MRTIGARNSRHVLGSPSERSQAGSSGLFSVGGILATDEDAVEKAQYDEEGYRHHTPLLVAGQQGHEQRRHSGARHGDHRHAPAPEQVRKVAEYSGAHRPRNTFTPQDKTAAPAVRPPNTPVRERERGVARPSNDVFFGYAPVQQTMGFSEATYPPLGIMRKAR